MIIDTHCHYNLDPLVGEWQHHWHNAQEHSVTNSILVGTSIESSAKAVELTGQVPQWLASVGIHPHDEYHQGDEELIENLITPQVIAIGECGLDYFRLPDDDTKDLIIEQQQQLLIAQIEIAKKHQLPLIIHLRDTKDTAYWDFLSLYKQHASTSLPFILHCISGPKAFVYQAVELGAHIGVAGNITYKNADHIRTLIASVPKDRVLLETDAPFLPPVPHRGHTCEPWMIQLTQQFLALELQISEETVWTNTTRLFPQFKREK